MAGLQESYADKDIRSFQLFLGASFLGIVILTGITAMALADRALRPIRRSLKKLKPSIPRIFPRGCGTREAMTSSVA